MAGTIIGMFENGNDAQRAVDALKKHGINESRIHVEPALGTSASTATTTQKPTEEMGGFQRFMVSLGLMDPPTQRTQVSNTDRSAFDEGLRRGNILVAVDSSEENDDEITNILSDAGAVDVDERVEEWRKGGWHAEDETTSATTTQAAAPAQPAARVSSTQGELKVPVVEEQLQVGKREVQRKGVRVYTRAVDRPVEETIRLQEEQIHVDRRPVDRPVTPADQAAFKEGTIEVTARGEEAVVSKQARVVEEVSVGKSATERDQTIQDTVRRHEVEVDESGGTQRRFEDYDNDFRTSYQSSFGNTGNDYTHYAPAYRYGYDLASSGRYSGDWSSFESDARRDWETRQPGTWEKFKDAIRYGWERVRGAGRATATRPAAQTTPTTAPTRPAIPSK